MNQKNQKIKKKEENNIENNKRPDYIQPDINKKN